MKGVAFATAVAILAFVVGRETAPGAGVDLASLSAKEMAESLRAALVDPDPIRGAVRIANLTELLRAENVSAAPEVVRNEFVTEDELRLFGQAWGRVEGEAAVADLAVWPTANRHILLRAVVEGWATRDPIAANRAIDGLDLPSSIEDLRLAAATGWAVSQEPGLLEYLSSWPKRQRQQALHRVVWTRLKRRPRDEVLSWVESVVEGSEFEDEFKSELLQKSVWLLAQVDPPRAAQWWERFVGRSYATNVSRLVAASWLARDSASGLAWLESLPAGAERDKAVEWGTARWRTANPEAAKAWIEGVKITRVWWPAVVSHARHVVKSDPMAALKWCGQIEGSASEADCLVDVGKSWVRQNPEAAKIWLDGSDLPQDVRERIEKRPKRSKGTATLGRLPFAPPSQLGSEGD